VIQAVMFESPIGSTNKGGKVVKISKLKELDKLIVNNFILKPLVEKEVVYICAKSWAIHTKVR